MITDKELYFRKSHKYLEDENGIKDLQDFMLGVLIENKDIPMVRTVLIDLHDIIFGKSPFFISRRYPNVKRLREKRTEIQRNFINFFLKDHIKDYISLYKFYRNKPFFLLDYLLPLIRFLPEAKPEEKYFVDLFLILGDVLSGIEENFDETLENIAIKGLLRYSVNKEIFRNILNDRPEKKFENMYKDVLPYENFIDYFKKSLNEHLKLIKMDRFNIEIASMCIFNSGFLNFFIWKGLYGEESVVKLYEKTEEKKEEIKNFIKKELSQLELSMNGERLLHNVEGVMEKLSSLKKGSSTTPLIYGKGKFTPDFTFGTGKEF